MSKHATMAAVWGDARAAFEQTARDTASLEIGQRFHRVELPSVVWRIVRVYRDSQGVEHATLASNRRDLDPKTLSAKVLLDRAHYRVV